MVLFPDADPGTHEPVVRGDISRRLMITHPYA